MQSNLSSRLGQNFISDLRKSIVDPISVIGDNAFCIDYPDGRVIVFTLTADGLEGAYFSTTPGEKTKLFKYDGVIEEKHNHLCYSFILLSYLQCRDL